MDTPVKSEKLRIGVTADSAVSGVVSTPEWWPSGQRIGIVLAHDVAKGMDEPGLVHLQESLAAHGHLALRFNFPYAENRKKRPDPDAVLDRTLRAAVGAVLADPENAPARLFVGGIGLGARVATRCVATGLKVDAAFSFGFPLHPSGKPSQQEVDYMYRIICPLLFVQGGRDPHCRIDKLEELLRRMGTPTRLHVIPDAGAGLEAIKKAGRPVEAVRADALGALEGYIAEIIGKG